MLVKNVAKQMKSDVEVIIDQKIDKYKKNDEVTGIVANHMLARAGMKKLVKSVTMHDSKHHLGLQVVDILTGAVNSGYLKYLNPRLELSVAKELAFERMAALLGWDVFHYDTFPNKISISGTSRKRCELCRVLRVSVLITAFRLYRGMSWSNPPFAPYGLFSSDGKRGTQGASILIVFHVAKDGFNTVVFGSVQQQCD
jgi:hypothetical protein